MHRGSPDGDFNTSNLSFLAGGGEMGERMRALDWSTTALGAADSWPQSLRSTVSMLLPSKAQIALFWGSQFVCLYNDAYRPVFGAKHPHALGLPGHQAWSEIWDQQLHQLLAGVVRTGEAFWARDLYFPLERHGFKEETFFDVSYDPVRVESGDVGGVFCIVTETTDRVIGERRMALLRDLAARNATARTMHDACRLAIETMAARPHDVTFALAYIEEVLQCATPGAEESLAASPPDLVRTLSIASTSGARAARVVVGLNPQRPFDDQYRAFIDLVADQFGTALANARAYEEERQRVEALAEIDRAKTEFFNNVSHEFRTPLTLLLGPTQDAISSPGQTLSGEALATVHRNAQRLLKLVNSLLDFSRTEAGRAEASYDPTELDVFTADLAGAFRSAVESAGLRCDVQCDPIGVPVRVDRSMWEKIVFNLLSNALKFTFDGMIRVALAREGDRVRLSVSDTVTGVAESDLPHLFERFHRVRGARSRSLEGSGIGLALVQELVKLHGGSVDVRSSVGQGTTFTVSIPIEADHLPAAIGPSRSLTSTATSASAYVSEALGWLKNGAGAAASTTSSQRPRILLADDNADMRDYVARLLGDRFDVETVSDGASALSAVNERRPHAVVTDVMMPELDGFELLRTLKDNAATRDIPVILLSARAGEEAALEAVTAGADDYVVKPFTGRDLIARVDAQLQRAQERQRARQQLVEANRIKDEFLATLSHELRTPLNAILGWAHLLRASTMRPGMLERALEAIDRNARAQAQLVDDLLDVSRVISGKLSVKRERVNLRAIVSEAIDAVRPALTAKAVKLRMDVASDADVVIDGDADRLRQVVWNLLSNAVKFTPSGGEVAVDLRLVTDAVEIVVRDTGIGIAPEFLPHVFDRFRQGDNGPSRKHGGLGLGLAIVHHLIEAHGGTVTASSNGPGAGSQFVIHLPIDSAQPRALPAVAAKGPALNKLISGLRVLVADDEPDAREVMRAALESHGGYVVSVSSANEALDAMRQTAFDVIVADIGMPEHDGYWLMRSIRALPPSQGGAIPAVAVTAYATLRERDDAKAAGFDAHMGKPFDPERLAVTLSKIATRH
jgi:signal transduction histidine kinase